MQDYSAQHDLLDPTPDLNVFDEHTVLEWSENHVFLIHVSRNYLMIKEGYSSVLSTTELKKARRFIKQTDYESYVVRTYFLRCILGAYFKVEPDTIQFQLSGNKKPKVEGIEFNISKRADLVTIAIGKSPIGIDTEFIRSDFSYGMMMTDSFSMPEQDMINQSDDSYTSFYMLWTRKEALLKASGDGLSDQALNEVEVLSTVCTHNGVSYQLLTTRILKDYMLSIALASSKKISYWSILLP